MICPFRNAWTHTMKIGFDVRSTGKNGLESWQQWKDFYSKMKSEGLLHVTDKCTMFDAQYIVSEDDTDHQYVKMIVNGLELDNTIEQDHFFIQLFRIPIMGNFKLPIVKIAQIAYNVGQFNATRESGYYDQRLLDYFDKYNIGDYCTTCCTFAYGDLN